MSSSSNLFFKLGHLTGLGTSDIQDGFSTTPQSRPGTIAFVVDAYGPKILKYVKNISNSTMAVAEHVGYDGDGANVITTTISNISAGSTTSATTTGLTADDHIGKICFVLDNADAAGTAPEGEMGVVADNSTTVITMDRDYPFSVALAANDDLELITTYQVVDTAASDEAWTCTGIVAAQDGILDNAYGWVVQHGLTPALTIANAITEG